MKEWIAQCANSSAWYRVRVASGKVDREELSAEEVSNLKVNETPAKKPLYVCGGLTDLQVNGYNGIDFADQLLNFRMVDFLCDELTSLGVTHFLATLTTNSLERLGLALKNIDRLAKRPGLFECMLKGIHLEGPFISSIDGPRGAHPRQFCRVPDVDEFKELQEKAGGRIEVLTMSPEYEGSAKFIETVSREVIVSIGHTAATPEQIRQAVDAGATMSTHLGNGMHKEVPRHPNYLWEQLADDRLVAGLIGDGVHLDSSTMKAMVRAKGIERCFLVSDSTVLSGKSPGLYENSALGDVEVTEDRRLVIAGQRTYNAGAYRPLKDAMPFMLNNGIADLGEVIEMMVENPRNIIGKGGGSQEEQSAEESLVLFGLDDENQMDIQVTVVDGVVAYDAE